jgi:hypothetical protein
MQWVVVERRAAEVRRLDDLVDAGAEEHSDGEKPLRHDE